MSELQSADSYLAKTDRKRAKWLLEFKTCCEVYEYDGGR